MQLGEPIDGKLVTIAHLARGWEALPTSGLTRSSRGKKGMWAF
jgi:hypothetical protein